VGALTGGAVLIAVALVASGCLGSSPASKSKTPGSAALSGSQAPTTEATHADPGATQLSVVSISPAPGAHGVGYGSEVTVRFSAPLARGSAMPKLSPAPPGSWTEAEIDELVFHPTGNYVPYSIVTLTLPGGPHGMLSKTGGILPRSVRARFQVAGVGELRLQQLLGELGYLPLRFVPGGSASGSAAREAGNTSFSEPQKATTSTTKPSTTTSTTRPKPTTTTSTTRPKPTTTTRPPTTTTSPPPIIEPPSVGAPGYTGTTLIGAPGPGTTSVEEPTNPDDIPLTPLPGKFSWRFDHIPRSLAEQWAEGQPNVITTGAIMQFEEAHGLATDGEAGPQVWSDLLRAVAGRQVNRAPYDYVYVVTGQPEYLSLWRDGVVIFKTLVNTGISEAPTELGTWPVYARYVVTTMTGTNPDGSHYSDPGIPWVSYFHGGDALHGFLRSQYGFPQSLGCVEMPYSSAGTLFPYTPLGTLVSILP
jgi:peptidoglycan hydrolase-like protein with peptidoglycan-binding domain